MCGVGVTQLGLCSQEKPGLRMEEEQKSGREISFACVLLFFPWVCEPSQRALFVPSRLSWFSVIYNPGP